METTRLKDPAEQTRSPSPAAVQDGVPLGPEAKRTTHLVLRTFDKDRRGIEILHQDLFDSDPQVVLSALEVLETIKDPRSLNHIARLLTQAEETVRLAAVKALGEIGHQGAAKVLFDLFKISKGDDLRCAALEALFRLCPEDPEVLRLVEEQAGSPIASETMRARATAVLLQLHSAVDVGKILAGCKEEVVEAVYRQAEADERISSQVIYHGLSNYHRLSAGNRIILTDLASRSTAQESGRILLLALEDVDADVRRSAYQALGRSPQQREYYPGIIRLLSDQVDLSPVLEEEALAAIERMEQSLGGRGGLNLEIKKRVYGRIQELFKALSTAERRVGSDNHELGWLMSRSREYLEYYAEEEFRQALLQYLKGSSYYTEERLLQALKDSAVKVEVGHFDGYRALADIIKNPKRHGMGLIARELAIARLGKRTILYQLIRNIRLAHLFSPAGSKVDALQLFTQVFSWAKSCRIYRLAEAALYALAAVDRKQTTAICSECLRPPSFSKILAIAAVHLLKELDWAVMEPAVVKLLGSGEDPYILLNLIDALSGMGVALSGQLVKALVQLLRLGKDREVLQRAADILGLQYAFNVCENLIAGFDQAEAWRQSLILGVIERQIAQRRVSNRESLIEFLYKILRTVSSSNQAAAAVLLWRLGDDYALKVLGEFVRLRSAEEKLGILRSLQGAITLEIVPILFPLLRSNNAGLQEALRETLLSTVEEITQEKICDMVLVLRGAAGFEGEFSAQKEEVEVQVDFLNEKKAYRFEREYIQELAILFTDIQGYSKKAQALTAMQLSSLIQEYEGILLPMIASHRGELIKKMGDGHLFVFSSPLDPVLTAVRLQKALKRFNSYREEKQRLIVRVGMHWGKVVRKEGDVLGNHVNLASRLESSAKGGSVLISEALQQRVEGYIHSREIGLINVKGFSEPVKVFEPYEMALDLPEELDPLKVKSDPSVQNPDGAPGHPENGFGKGRVVVLDPAMVSYIVETFSRLNGLCLKAEKNQITFAEVRRELGKRWVELKAALMKGAQK